MTIPIRDYHGVLLQRISHGGNRHSYDKYPAVIGTVQSDVISPP
jgi:hypothetical protein